MNDRRLLWVSHAPESPGLPIAVGISWPGAPAETPQPAWLYISIGQAKSLQMQLEDALARVTGDQSPRADATHGAPPSPPADVPAGDLFGRRRDA